MRPVVTLASVRATYSADKRWRERATDPLFYWLYRPLSFWLTVPLASLRLPANLVTLFGAFLSVSLVVLAKLGVAVGWLGLLAILVEVLDGVDGNLARLSGRPTRLGAYFDSLNDRLASVLLLWTLGIVAGRSGLADAHVAERNELIAVLAGSLTLLSRFCDDFLEKQTGANRMTNPEIANRTLTEEWVAVGGGLRRLWPILLAPAAWFGLDQALLGLAAVHAVCVFLYIQRELYRAFR